MWKGRAQLNKIGVLSVNNVYSRHKAKLFLCPTEPVMVVPRRNKTGSTSNKAAA